MIWFSGLKSLLGLSIFLVFIFKTASLAFALGPVFCPSALETVLNETEFGKKIVKEFELSDLRQLSVKSAEQVRVRNDFIIQKLNSLPVPKSSSRMVELTLAQATAIFDKVRIHSPANIKELERYDPQARIGFCFGRSMAIHLQALQSGVHKESILKVYAIGNLQSGGISNSYHVATMIRAKGGRWWVLDPRRGEVVLDLESWYQKMRVYDSSLSLAITAAERGFVESANPYLKDSILDKHWNGYFNDLLRFFRLEAKRKMQTRLLRDSAFSIEKNEKLSE